MRMPTIAGLALVLCGGAAQAHEVVHEETQGEWTSYELKCDSGHIRYITKNTKGYWARGKNYDKRKEAVAVACEH